jgi:hypothetical protein
MVEQLAGVLWRSVDGSLKGSLRDRAARLPTEIRSEAEGVIEAAGFSAEQVTALEKLTPLALQEWGIGDNASPTACIGAMMGCAALSWVRSARALESLAKRHAAAP